MVFSVPKNVAWLLVAIIVLASIFWSRIYLKPGEFLGDEPHYLVTTESLARDGDVNVKNDYLEYRYAHWHPNPLDYHIKETYQTSDAAWYSVHNVGLPVYLLPFYTFLRLTGVTLAMLAVSWLVLALTYLWTRRVTGSEIAGWVATAVLFTALSFRSLADTVFPDLPIAAGLLGALLLLDAKSKRWPHWLGLGLIAGLLPWIHIKTVLISATIIGIGLYQLWRERPAIRRQLLALLIVPWLLLLACFELKTHQWFGAWNPSAAYAGGAGANLFKQSPLFTIPAMLFDAGKGLLSNNPALWLIFIGLPIWMKRAPRQLKLAALLILPSFLLNATFTDWWGGYAPPARYLMEIVPAFLPAAGLLVWYLRRRLVVLLAAILLMAQAWFTMTYLVSGAKWTSPTVANPVFSVMQEKLHASPSRLLPHFEIGRITLPQAGLASLYVMATLGFVWYGSILARDNMVRRRRKKVSSRT